MASPVTTTQDAKVPLLRITVELMQEGDQSYVHVTAPTTDRLMCVGMLMDAIRLIQDNHQVK